MALDIIVARAFIEKPDGDVLWTIRRKEDSGSGLLCLPGGKVEKGESVRVALTREVFEETGYMLGAISDHLFTDQNLAKPQDKYPNIYFKAESYWGSTRDSSENLIWLPYSELDKYNFAFWHGFAWERYENMKKEGKI